MLLWVPSDIWNNPNLFTGTSKTPNKHRLLTLSLPNSPDLSWGTITIIIIIMTDYAAAVMAVGGGGGEGGL